MLSKFLDRQLQVQPQVRYEQQYSSTVLVGPFRRVEDRCQNSSAPFGIRLREKHKKTRLFLSKIKRTVQVQLPCGIRIRRTDGFYNKTRKFHLIFPIPIENIICAQRTWSRFSDDDRGAGSGFFKCNVHSSTSWSSKTSKQ